MKENVIARITVRGWSKYSPEFRKTLADWMRKQADDLEREPEKYTSGLFVARYIEK